MKLVGLVTASGMSLCATVIYAEETMPTEQEIQEAKSWNILAAKGTAPEMLTPEELKKLREYLDVPVYMRDQSLAYQCQRYCINDAYVINTDAIKAANQRIKRFEDEEKNICKYSTKLTWARACLQIAARREQLIDTKYYLDIANGKISLECTKERSKELLEEEVVLKKKKLETKDALALKDIGEKLYLNFKEQKKCHRALYIHNTILLPDIRGGAKPK